jgi:hypothetical protein
MGRPKRVVAIDGVGPQLGPGEPEPTGIVLVADIADLPGMTISRSDTKATVRAPTVVTTPSSVEDSPDSERLKNPISIMEEVIFKKASEFTWPLSV